MLESVGFKLLFSIVNYFGTCEKACFCVQPPSSTHFQTNHFFNPKTFFKSPIPIIFLISPTCYYFFSENQGCFNYVARLEYDCFVSFF
jgi:hypothetical protein